MGSGARNLTTKRARDSDPTWSPDRKWIAFASDRDGNADIYRVTAKGTRLKRLTNNPAVDLVPNYWQPKR
jgi:Tol biopolymer transport system component